MTLKPYGAQARMGVRASRYFGLAELVGGYALRALRVCFLLLLWQSLFQNGGDMDGMTLEQTLKYTLCANALSPLLDVRTPAGSWLHDGTVAGCYLRPMNVLGQLAAHALGAAVVPLCVFTPLCMLLGALMGVSLAPQSPWFFASLLLCASQGLAVDLLFACLIIRVGSLSWQVHTLREALSVMLTGKLIPFAALPWGLGNALALSPLGTLAGAPLGLYAGLGAPGSTLPALIAWNLILWPLCLWCFAKSRERMVSFGG